MKHQLALLIILSSLLATGCSKASESTNAETEASTVQSQKASKKFSPEDQKIIDKYNKELEYLTLEEDEKFHARMKNLIPEINKISDKAEREKNLMNIYLVVGMNEEAYALNEKQLKEKPNDTARLTFRCQLLTLQKKESTLINKCYDNVADVLKVELDKPENKRDPDYKIGEFSYLYAKYKAGHPEYKEKMQEYIAETKDEKLKATLTSLYNVEFEN
ncbi:hypothetical protein [Acinetobacter baumannii]|uniref:hypothetical protein n=1 Tax=Acinetobacter baumannii TaxID=470 RepID=UPI00112DA78A|nr:hypothetical protein [Acinetobacter baumannii]EHU2649441.1 hypothetical protein [Acinetobacter baumannii]TPU95068.1 hypothetical protein FJV26_14395 [Acinetobacter baumannii]